MTAEAFLSSTVEIGIGTAGFAGIIAAGSLAFTLMVKVATPIMLGEFQSQRRSHAQTGAQGGQLSLNPMQTQE